MPLEGTTSKRSRRNVIKGLGVAGIAGLAGCSGDGGGDGSGGSGGETNGDATKTTAASDVEITFWESFGGTEASELKTLISEFEDENPNITVNTQSVPFGEVTTKLTTAAASGNAPHVASYWMSFSSYFNSEGILDPIDDYLQDGLDPYYDIVEPAATAGGNTVALPIDIHGMMLATNNTVLEEAGAPAAPSTPDELAEAANAVKENTDKRPFFLQTYDNLYEGFRVYFSLVKQQGGNMFENGDPSTGNPVFHETDAGLAAAKFYDSVTGEQGWDDTDDLSDTDVRINEFKNDQAAMGFMGNWMANRLQNDNNEFIDGLDFTYHPPWAFAGGTKETFCESNGFFFPSNPSHTNAEKKARVKFVEYITQNNPVWATKAGHLPPTPKVAESDEVTSHPIYDEYGIVETLADMAANDQLRYQPRADINLYAPEIGGSLSSIYAQNVEPQEGITKSATAIRDRMN
ncbi:carbohydrate ABC transporter substrate-binding protein, CUT1 family [Halomicrobium zhouii]|uniref:Carbohydrate ABC transporter substrate-binding protein, CUT1 family n=1 Tax=Halomicrobium zhouii TaxID=767519 RepID=A0A1I6L0S2_9EURY|nr:extracellular solute-binding protein [Halomicrobium zhouii]SFR97073.1 carbohydrate ABC transporter substrate-binding protein, CUT1 family [Halomicrobium zhouii]